MPNLADALAAAKLWLISSGTADLPYLSQALFALVTVESDAVATVAADERWRLYVNPGWASEAAVEDVARELAHQAWHLLLDHAGRAQEARVDGATAASWGEAADLAVADALGAEGVLPPWLTEASRRARAARPGLSVGRSAEEYYRVFGGAGGGIEPEDGERDDGDRPAESRRDDEPDGLADEDWHGRDGSASDGQGRDGSSDGPGRDGSASDGRHRPWELPVEAESGELAAPDAEGVRRAVALAFLADRRGRPGEAAGEVERWARRIAEPRIAWEHLLAQAARRGLGWTSGRTHTTYTRPNRRSSSVPGVLLPGWRRQNPAVACVIDTSGSVDEALLGRALDEVEGALRSLGVAGRDLTVLTCDASVHTVQRVRHAGDAQLVGGGGTDLRVALAAVEGLRPRPTLAVVFTDGETPWPDQPPPGCAVVVALLLRPGVGLADVPAVPDWAAVIECRVDA